MSGAAFNVKVAAAYKKAAALCGLSFSHYRPSGASNPTAAGNLLGQRVAQFTVHGSSNVDFVKPRDHKSPLFNGLMDTAGVSPGDYFVNAAIGTFFIADLAAPAPPLAVMCNRTVTAWKPGPQTSQVGALGYGGTVASTAATIASADVNETAIMTGWPAALLTRSTFRAKYLPADAGNASWELLIPRSGSTILRQGTIFTDDLGNRFVAFSTALHGFYWRVDVELQVV